MTIFKFQTRKKIYISKQNKKKKSAKNLSFAGGLWISHKFVQIESAFQRIAILKGAFNFNLSV
jgi:hypothetical protein